MAEGSELRSDAGAGDWLVDAVQRLSAVDSIGDVTAVVRTAARRMARADGAAFVLRDGDKCHYADEDAIGPLWKGRRFPMEACVSGWVMRNRQPTIIPDVFADPRVPHDAYRVTFVKSLAMVPIRSLDPLGAIGIYWSRPHSPTPEAVRWLQSLADSTALAIEHLTARKELRKSRSESDLLRTANADLRRDAAAREPTGLVRMCYITGRIEAGGRWLSVEEFLAKRFGLDVTHGICPEALARMKAEPRATAG